MMDESETTESNETRLVRNHGLLPLHLGDGSIVPIGATADIDHLLELWGPDGERVAILELMSGRLRPVVLPRQPAVPVIGMNPGEASAWIQNREYEIPHLRPVAMEPEEEIEENDEPEEGTLEAISTPADEDDSEDDGDFDEDYSEVILPPAPEPEPEPPKPEPKRRGRPPKNRS